MSDIGDEFEKKINPIVDELYEICKRFDVELGVLFSFPDGSLRSSHIMEEKHRMKDFNRIDKALHLFHGIKEAKGEPK